MPACSPHLRRALCLLWLFVLAGCGGGGGGSAVPGAAAGSVVVAGYTAVDSDLNDPAAPFKANDSLEQAQAVAAPATIGGYLNRPGAGPAGRSRDTGDPQDVFQVELAAGQQAILHAAPLSADGELELYLLAADDSGTVLDAAVGSALLKMVSAPRSGSFYLIVRTRAGAAHYILSIATAQAAPGIAQLRLSEEFVPGEVVARFKQRHGLAAAGTGESAAGLTLKSAGTGGPVLLTLDAAARPVGRAALASPPAAESGPAGVPLSAEQQAKLDTLLAIESLRDRPDIEYAEPNFIRQGLAVPNDPDYRRQWHYPFINLPLAWELRDRERATDPIVAVIDTGVLSDHPDLQGVFVDGYDFISDRARALDGDGIDPDPYDPGDQAKGGSTFHGTHVAGTIAARTGNGIGVAGIAWGARIMPLRVLGKGGATSYDVQQAGRYAIGLANDSGRRPKRRADIINLSLGGGGWSYAEQELIRQARQRGVIVIAAAGNDGNSRPFYPAAYQGVVAVSAVDRYGRRAPYSNYGSYVDIAAPGGNLDADLDGDGYPDGIRSTAGWSAYGRIIDGYRSYHGTSMAAPHVAGVAALMKAIAPEMSPADFDALLAAGELTNDFGAPGRDNVYGHGLLDAYRAVLAAHMLANGTVPDLPPQPPLVQPPALIMNAQTAAAVVTVSEPATAVPAIAAVRASVPWLSAGPTMTDAAGFGHYTIAADRRGLAPGTYNAYVEVASSAGTVKLPVTVVVEKPSSPGTAGPLHVLLIDARTRTAVAQQTIAAAGGIGEFRFQRVPPGSYVIVAGADADNDGRICGPGEACSIAGADPQTVTVTDDSLTTVTTLVVRFDPTLPRRSPEQGFRRLR